VDSDYLRASTSDGWSDVHGRIQLSAIVVGDEADGAAATGSAIVMAPERNCRARAMLAADEQAILGPMSCVWSPRGSSAGCGSGRDCDRWPGRVG